MAVAVAEGAGEVWAEVGLLLMVVAVVVAVIVAVGGCWWVWVGWWVDRWPLGGDGGWGEGRVGVGHRT